MVLPFFCGSGVRVDDIADDDRAGDLGGVDLFLFEADLHQVLGQLLVRKAFRNLDVVLEPINVNHRHGFNHSPITNCSLNRTSPSTRSCMSLMS